MGPINVRVRCRARCRSHAAQLAIVKLDAPRAGREAGRDRVRHSTGDITRFAPKTAAFARTFILLRLGLPVGADVDVQSDRARRVGPLTSKWSGDLAWPVRRGVSGRSGPHGVGRNEAGGPDATDAVRQSIPGREIRCELEGEHTHYRCVAVFLLEVQRCCRREGAPSSRPGLRCTRRTVLSGGIAGAYGGRTNSWAYRLPWLLRGAVRAVTPTRSRCFSHHHAREQGLNFEGITFERRRLRRYFMVSGI
jgi:hypothetical protein